MKQKTIAGLQFRNGVYHMDKVVAGQRISGSTGTSDLKQAEQILAKRVTEIREAKVLGFRPKKTFKEAALHYEKTHSHKKSLDRDLQDIRSILPFIGDLTIDRIHNGTLRPYIEYRQKQVVKSSTINRTLRVVSRILTLCATDWRLYDNVTWLAQAPMISQIAGGDAKPAFPLSWAEQERLFGELPEHLRDAALFAVNTGCRMREITNLRWEWKTHGMCEEEMVFFLPATITKNKSSRIVCLNSVAREAVKRQEGKSRDYVFTYKGKPMERLNNSAWRRAREKCGLEHVRFHDLRHTTASRLRSTGSSLSTVADILGHEKGSVTERYSVAKANELFAALERITVKPESEPRYLSDLARFLQGEVTRKSQG